LGLNIQYSIPTQYPISIPTNVQCPRGASAGALSLPWVVGGDAVDNDRLAGGDEQQHQGRKRSLRDLAIADRTTLPSHRRTVLDDRHAVAAAGAVHLAGVHAAARHGRAEQQRSVAPRACDRHAWIGQHPVDLQGVLPGELCGRRPAAVGGTVAFRRRSRIRRASPVLDREIVQALALAPSVRSAPPVGEEAGDGFVTVVPTRGRHDRYPEEPWSGMGQG
jgi:hypothetical protein